MTVGIGLGMTVALHAVEPFPLVSAREIQRREKSGHEPLFQCCSKGCGAQVSFVGEFTRLGKPVRAHFRLKPGQSHHLDCPFRIDRYLVRLCAESHSLDGGGSALEKLRGSDRFVLRLNGPCLGFADNRVTEAISRESEGRHVQFRSLDRLRMSPYLRSALAVAKLRAQLTEQSAEELESRIRIEISKGNEISWSDFYFDEDRWPNLVASFKANGWKHFVAIHGVARVPKKPTTGAYSIQMSPLTVRDSKKRKRVCYAPWLHLSNNRGLDDLKNLRKDQALTALAMPLCRERECPDVVYQNIDIRIESDKQFALL